MIRSVRLARGRSRGGAEIQIAPLIDLMFTLLLFYVVTTTFVRETGLEVERPRARSAAPLEKHAILVGVGPSGEVYWEGRRIDLITLRGLVSRRLARQPGAGVVLVADRRTPAEWVVRVMDEAKRGGARTVALASRKEMGP
ncbi:MAG TPA: biopolymer transporter ExbD [Planctomycetota bacterium]|jgi:biopolymer transport protein ExbD|nr:biopolymer transporter ExbD [Planctomycetota bacterium]